MVSRAWSILVQEVPSEDKLLLLLFLAFVLATAHANMLASPLPLCLQAHAHFLLCGLGCSSTDNFHKKQINYPLLGHNS